MPPPSKAERLADVHDRAITAFAAVWSALREERLNCLNDRRFYSISGAQWEGALQAQFANLPMFEVNKVHLAVVRIFNEYRNNRISVQFRPKDEDSSSDTADTMNGVFRADEQDSGAQEAYDNAFEEGVGGGFGALRLRNVLEDDEDNDNDRQRIVIEPIYDADTSVFWNLDAKRYDKSDATKCWELTAMTPDAYAAEWPDSPAPSSFTKPANDQSFDWFRPSVVYVAAYYEVETKRTVQHVYRLEVPGNAEPEEQTYTDDQLDDDTLQTLQAAGWREVRQVRRKVRKVHKYIINGAEVLSDEGFVAGCTIPVVPFYGKRWFVENVERCCGHVRHAKDAQRLKNMQISRIAQIAALSPVEKPILTPEQIAGFEQYWAEDNIEQYAYMLVNALRNPDGSIAAIGPQAYTKAPSVPQALAALLELTENDLGALLGNQEAGEQVTSNVSAKLVELVQQRLDMQTFIYMDNMRKTVQRVGEVWRDMAREVYVEDSRSLKSVNEVGESEFVKLNVPKVDDSGKQILGNDLSGGRFEAVADVGPSYRSRRDSTVRALTAVLQATQDPDLQNLLTSMVIMNMDGEGMKDLHAYMRKQLIAKGVIEPTEQEAQDLAAQQQNEPPDPQAQYLQASAAQALANADRAKAQTVEAGASAQLKHAQAIKALAEAGRPEPLPTP